MNDFPRIWQHDHPSGLIIQVKCAHVKKGLPYINSTNCRRWRWSWWIFCGNWQFGTLRVNTLVHSWWYNTPWLPEKKNVLGDEFRSSKLGGSCRILSPIVLGNSWVVWLGFDWYFLGSRPCQRRYCDIVPRVSLGQLCGIHNFRDVVLLSALLTRQLFNVKNVWVSGIGKIINDHFGRNKILMKFTDLHRRTWIGDRRNMGSGKLSSSGKTFDVPAVRDTTIEVK